MYKISSKINEKLKEKKKDEEEKLNEQSVDNESTNNSSKLQTFNTTSHQINKEIETPTTDIKSKTTSEVINELNKIKDKLSNPDYIDAPESLELTKIDVPEKSNEDLITIAKNSLENKYNTKKESSNDTFSKQIENILANKESLKRSAEEQVDKLNSIYSQSKSETEQQALKRGLARSSIIIGQLSSIENSRANELVNVLNTLQTNLQANEHALQNLEKERDLALNNLDIEYAIELEEKIQDVTNEYQKARQEAIDFNNNINKLEAEYKLKLDNQKIDKQKKIASLEETAHINYNQDQIEKAQYNYLKSYLDSLDKEYAINLLLKNEDFKNILGSRYSEMYRYLTSK